MNQYFVFVSLLARKGNTEWGHKVHFFITMAMGQSLYEIALEPLCDFTGYFMSQLIFS